MEDSDYENNT